MTQNRIEFPLVMPGGRLRRPLAIALGRLFGLVMPGRKRRLVAGQLPERLGAIDRWMLGAFLDSRMRRAGGVDDLLSVHRGFWRGPQAEAFHRMAEERFTTWWLGHHLAIVEPLRETMRRAGISTLCEIGCGSGRVLADLAGRLPEVTQWIGLDLSEAQTASNRQRHAGATAMRFETGDVCEWVPAHAQPGWAYFTNAGVLEYLPETRLRTLLTTLAGALAPAVCAWIEPVNEDFDLEREPHSRVAGYEHSFSHPHPTILREAGWEVTYQSEQRFAGYRWLLIVARTSPPAQAGIRGEKLFAGAGS